MYVFETRDSVSDRAFASLMAYRNCLILADSSVLSQRQIEELIISRKELMERAVNVIVFESKNNRDLSGLLRQFEIQKTIESGEIPQIVLSNKLDVDEMGELNPKLTAVTAGVFSSEGKTIVDNLIAMSNELIEKNKYQNIVPKFGTEREIAALISLAVEKKLHSSKVIQYDFLDEINLQIKCATPPLERETTWAFEKSYGDNSPLKYVVNAEYWLWSEMEKYASDTARHADIIKAYQYMITKIIEYEGKPSLLWGDDSAYKAYILFDNINRIFSSHGRGGLSLIQKIYENLNDYLSTAPSYMHQRAKCYIKSMLGERIKEEKIHYLDKAFRDTSVSKQVFQNRYERSKNYKLLISIAHVDYTRAVIYCNRCQVNEYRDADENRTAVELLHTALHSPHNTYDYARKDSINKNNVIDELVMTLMSKRSMVSSEVYRQLETLFQIMRGYTAKATGYFRMTNTVAMRCAYVVP